jgi:TonB family protein
MASNSDAPRKRLSGARGKLAGGGAFATFALEDDADRRKLRWAIAIAAILHVALLTVPVLRATRASAAPAPKPKVYVVRRYRFQPPPPQEQLQPRRAARIVPIPDETPDGPEPIRVVEQVQPELDLPDEGVLAGIPEAPPAVEPEGPLPVGGAVSAPQKIFAPQPQYTHAALVAHIEGPVVVRATIDKSGRVTDVEVLRGVPMGLTEAAVDAVRQWRFQPATLRGRPVSVYYDLTVAFRMH